MMTYRICKAMITALVASYFTLVVINNLLVPETNLLYVSHVMSMDTLEQSNSQQWRALSASGVHYAGFILIVLFEALAASLCWAGAWKMLFRHHFARGKALATLGLTLAFVIWFGFFFVVGGEWFLAWQTPWGGLNGAIRVITVSGFALILIHLPENQESA